VLRLVVVVVVVRGGKLAFGCFGAHTFSTKGHPEALASVPYGIVLVRVRVPKGKRLGQRACIRRVAQGQHGGGMRVLGVFEIGRESACA